MTKVILRYLALVRFGPVEGDPLRLRSLPGITLLHAESGEAERRHLYEAVLNLNWFPRAAREAVAKELGTTLRELEDRDLETAARMFTDIVKKKMREEGHRGRLRDAALEQLAGFLGKKPEAFKKRLQRIRGKQRQRARRRTAH